MAGQNYDNPLTITYPFTSHDFGAGAAAHAIRVPAGKKFARIEEVGLNEVTETFTATTTPAYVRVGTAADADKFVELNLGTTAATDAIGIRDDADAVLDSDNLIDLARDGDSGAELVQLEVTFVATTGGTPAGIGKPIIVISWF